MQRVRMIRPKAPTSLTLLDAIGDPRLFAPWFREPASWEAWRAFIASLFALPMSSEELAIYRQCTGRSEPPHDIASEAWLVCGRRAGKSFILALVAVYLACFRDYRRYLAPGERGTILIIATDRKQSRVIFRFLRALLTQVPMLARMIERENRETFDLVNSVTIEIAVASFRSTRGYTLVAALCDEIAFWANEDAAEPDYEVLNALRPGMATIPGAMLLCASSPYARRGALWDAWRRYFGKPDGPLVWQAATRVMNPTVPQSVIDEAAERDPAHAAAEYGAQFRSDIEAFVSREVVEACISPGVHERPRMAGVRYVAFCDPSGGSSDSMTLAVAHREKDAGVILDCIRERKSPFSPDAVVQEFAATLKSYGLAKVTGDKYAGEWPRERFKVHGIAYEPAAKPKSDLYRDVLPLLNSKQLDLLDHERLRTQLIGLERRTARGGRDSIDHAPGAHDDIANAVAGVVTACKRGGYDSTYSWVGSTAEIGAWRREQMVNSIFSGRCEGRQSDEVRNR
jgi:hypothetical protein